LRELKRHIAFRDYLGDHPDTDVITRAGGYIDEGDYKDCYCRDDYCRSGRRSKEASAKLAALGYTSIFEFGGILDWDGEIEN